MRLLLLLLRPLYHLLYHQFAWAYDLVADLVSLGQWQGWIQVALPRLNGRVLELGFGPGHLQTCMNKDGRPAFGLDESRSMATQASRRLKKAGLSRRLVRGLAQNLPFPAGSFDTIIATFPAEFIYSPATLLEARRVLTANGSLIILPLAWITGRLPWERLLAWCLRMPGETPGQPGLLPEPVLKKFLSHGFHMQQEIVSLPHSKVIVLTARNLPQEPARS